MSTQPLAMPAPERPARIAWSGAWVPPLAALGVAAAYIVLGHAWHADDAARLCASWPAPVVADWLADLRARYGF